MKTFATALMAAISAKAALATISCDADNLCPESAPCCSQYGECGVGLYCLGGCNPLFSYSLDACTAKPVCQDVTTTFTSTDQLESRWSYLGDANSTDWTYEGLVVQGDDSVLVGMNKSYTSTVLSSTHYVWYGKMSVKMKTARTQGVITTFITMSDVHDEIDFEFVGADLETAQSNFYFQGIDYYGNSANGTIDSDSFENYHTYTLDWQEDELTWAIDGTVFRTLKKSETYNSTTGEYKYPQTPSRMQMSVWASGLEDTASGTVAWGGGYINWDSEDITDKGYFYATLAEATIECYDTPSGANVSGSTSYVYTDNTGLNTSVAIVDEATTLNNFEDTNLNRTAGAAASSGAVATATSGVSSSTGSSTSSSSSSSSSGFSQGTSGATTIRSDSALFAIVVAMLALVAL